MKRCFDFIDIFKNFRTLIKTQNSILIKCFRCDLGDEYASNDFSSFLTSNDTLLQTSYTYTLENNGVT